MITIGQYSHFIYCLRFAFTQSAYNSNENEMFRPWNQHNILSFNDSFLEMIDRFVFFCCLFANYSNDWLDFIFNPSSIHSVELYLDCLVRDLVDGHRKFEMIITLLFVHKFNLHTVNLIEAFRVCDFLFFDGFVTDYIQLPDRRLPIAYSRLLRSADVDVISVHMLMLMFILTRCVAPF